MDGIKSRLPFKIFSTLPEQLSIPQNKLPYSGVRHFCFCCCIAMPMTSLISLPRHLQSKSINLIQENLGCAQKLEQDQRPQIEFSTWTKSILVQSLYLSYFFQVKRHWKGRWIGKSILEKGNKLEAISAESNIRMVSIFYSKMQYIFS